jgi:hypothetical protein
MQVAVNQSRQNHVIGGIDHTPGVVPRDKFRGGAYIDNAIAVDGDSRIR